MCRRRDVAEEPSVVVMLNVILPHHAGLVASSTVSRIGSRSSTGHAGSLVGSSAAQKIEALRDV